MLDIKNMLLGIALTCVVGVGSLWAPLAKAAGVELHNCRLYVIVDSYGQAHSFIVCSEGTWPVPSPSQGA